MRKKKKQTKKASQVRKLNKIFSKYKVKTNFKWQTFEHDDAIDLLTLYIEDPTLFSNNPLAVYTLAMCFLEEIFISKRDFRTQRGKLPKHIFQKSVESDVIAFILFEKYSKIFPELHRLLKNAKNENEERFLIGMRNIMKKFNEKGGGTMRKIIITLLRKEGVDVEIISKICCVSEDWARRAKNKTTDAEINQFFKRFNLIDKKKMFSKNELVMVKKFFDQKCHADSSSTKAEYKQLVGDTELFNQYQKFVLKENRLQRIINMEWLDLKIRSYNVFLSWKCDFKVRKMNQKDIDFNCPHCFDYHTITKKLKDLLDDLQIEKDEELKNKKEIEKLKGKIMDDLNMNKLLKLNKTNIELTTKLKENEKKKIEIEIEIERLEEDHLKVKKRQRNAVENIENSMEPGTSIVFLDFSKFNYCIHDLGFVIIWVTIENVDNVKKRVVHRKYLHYFHPKYVDKKKFGNDGRYAVTAWRMMMEKMKECCGVTENFYVASDGGKHFVCGMFKMELSRYKIKEYNRFAPHHGGNYCDMEFGVCKRTLRLHEQKAGRQIRKPVELAKCLRAGVVNRDVSFIVMENDSFLSDEELGYKMKNSPFPKGVKKFFCWQFTGFKGFVKMKKLSDKVVEDVSEDFEKKEEENKGDGNVNYEWEEQKLRYNETVYFPNEDEEKNEDEVNYPKVDENGDVVMVKSTRQKLNAKYEECDDEEDEKDEIENFKCSCKGCGSVIDKNEGYLRCVGGGCQRVYHYQNSCYGWSWTREINGEFKCRDCNRGKYDHIKL